MSAIDSLMLSSKLVITALSSLFCKCQCLLVSSGAPAFLSLQALLTCVSVPILRYRSVSRNLAHRCIFRTAGQLTFSCVGQRWHLEKSGFYQQKEKREETVTVRKP